MGGRPLLAGIRDILLQGNLIVCIAKYFDKFNIEHLQLKNKPIIIIVL